MKYDTFDIVYTALGTALMTWLFNGNPVYGLIIGLTPVLLGRFIGTKLAIAMERERS